MWLLTKEIHERRTALDRARLDTVHPTPPRSAVADGGALTPERLTELRSALATFSSAPLVTLEAHPLPKKRDRSAGLPLDAVSPLAQELSRLVAANAKSVPAVAQVAESSEVLYRMVVPAKVAAQVGKGLVKPMTSKAVAGGIYGNLVDAATNVSVAKATFVPVETAAAGAASTGVPERPWGRPLQAVRSLSLRPWFCWRSRSVRAPTPITSDRRPSSTSPSCSRSSTTTSWSASATNSTAAATRSTRPPRCSWIAERSARPSGWTQPFTRSALRPRTRTAE